MPIRLRPILLLSISFALFGCQVFQRTHDGNAVHWGYEGEIGPEYWGSLSPDFLLCEHGVNQSPIDIQTTIEADLEPIDFHYSGRTESVINNGHTLQVNVEPGSYMKVGEDRYDLQQFHFHSPSEHHLQGEDFPLEGHFVHQDEQGRYAVTAVMFRLGEAHEDLARIGEASRIKTGEPNPIDLDLSTIKLHPAQRDYYRYSGSLTTPPCTEGIAWFILKKRGHISQEQVDRFIRIIGADARGLQPQNARIVVEH